MRKIAGIVSVLGLLAFTIPVRADEDAPVREIIARAIKAQGGSDLLKKYQGRVAKSKGKFYGFGDGVEYTGETSVQLPNRIRTEVQSKFNDQEFTFVQVIADGKGWIKIGDKTDEMNKDMLDESKEQMNALTISHLVFLNDKKYKLSPLGEVKVGDHPAIGVRVEHKGYRDVSLFFDKDKGLLLQMETRGKDPMRGGEEYTATTRYSEYKKVEGMMYPYKITIKHDGKRFVEGEVVEVKVVEKVDDSVFEKP